ncbi:uncharacterized protein C12orf56 homolog isoform X3 [Equus quagga]|uniref:uncharacterized protein C12orf56 homolog isoform X3 n=1 Tax=Equus quagga TaxID=89248 RepID=UPI001EE2CF6F|nr:uncharacterized protein C12orf56 homolog isoform X3 [Equus quagga]
MAAAGEGLGRWGEPHPSPSPGGVPEGDPGPVCRPAPCLLGPGPGWGRAPGGGGRALWRAGSRRHGPPRARRLPRAHQQPPGRLPAPPPAARRLRRRPRLRAVRRGVRLGEAHPQVRGAQRPAHLPDREPAQVHPAGRGAAGRRGHRPVKEEKNGPVFWRGRAPASLNEAPHRYRQESSTLSGDSLLCPPSDLKKPSLHGQRAFRPLPIPSRRSRQLTSAAGKAVSVPSCTANTKEPQGLRDHGDSLSEIPFQCDGNGHESHLGNSSLASPFQSNPNLEKKESELHLYIISTASSIFLHLKSSWNNYIIKATLLQDPLSVSELRPAAGSQKPYRSEEKIKHFSQLKSELFLKDNTLRKMLCLITQLKLAAQKNFILKRLFWKTSDLFYFLVSKLHEYLPESRDKNALQNKSRRADELVACIEIVQTLGLMFRETETELSRLNTLAAKEGTLFNLLVILISEPQIPKSCPVFDIQLVADSTLAEMSFDAELQKLILEYTDTATALLYEILLVFQQGNLGLGSTQFAVSWLMSFLQSRPPIMTFVASVVKQVVKGLSASLQLLSPGQAVLLYQQLCILRSCLQYSKTLAEYIRNDYREEFRHLWANVSRLVESL